MLTLLSSSEYKILSFNAPATTDDISIWWPWFEYRYKPLLYELNPFPLSVQQWINSTVHPRGRLASRRRILHQNLQLTALICKAASCDALNHPAPATLSMVGRQAL
jgi:hypothetical protein